MERNSTIAAWRLPGGINSAVDKAVSAMILSHHDSVPPFADKQVTAYGRVPSRGNQDVSEQAVSRRHVIVKTFHLAFLRSRSAGACPRRPPVAPRKASKNQPGT
jgi:hypothetical protein